MQFLCVLIHTCGCLSLTIVDSDVNLNMGNLWEKRSHSKSLEFTNQQIIITLA